MQCTAGDPQNHGLYLKKSAVDTLATEPPRQRWLGSLATTAQATELVLDEKRRQLHTLRDGGGGGAANAGAAVCENAHRRAQTVVAMHPDAYLAEAVPRRAVWPLQYALVRGLARQEQQHRAALLCQKAGDGKTTALLEHIMAD